MTLFNRYASIYDQWYQTPKGHFIDQIETELVFQMLKTKPHMTVLDLGCGTGTFSFKLAKKGCHVIGVDQSKEMIVVARKKAMELELPVNFYEMDALHLAYPDHNFDAVISITAIEFSNDPVQFMAEAYRVVVPQGQIVIGTINKDSPWGRHYLEEGKSQDSIYHGAHFLNQTELNQLAFRSSPEIKECLYVSPDNDSSLFNFEEENHRKENQKGGFLCARWIKK